VRARAAGGTFGVWWVLSIHAGAAAGLCIGDTSCVWEGVPLVEHCVALKGGMAPGVGFHCEPWKPSRPGRVLGGPSVYKSVYLPLTYSLASAQAQACRTCLFTACWC
jgi:hypothetical protein